MTAKAKVSASQSNPEVNWRDYVGVLFRGRWIIIGTFGVIFGGAILYTRVADRTYQATASVKIDTKQMRSSVLGDESASYGPNLTVTQNELEVLKSNAVIESAARKLRTQKFRDEDRHVLLDIARISDDPRDTTGLAPAEVVSSRIRTAVEFEPVRDSDVMKITATSKNAEEAAIIANLYTQAYAERNVYASRTRTRAFREFLEEQTREKQRSLAKSEEELRRFMEKKGVVSLDGESRKVIEQLSQLEAQRDAVEITIQSLEKTLQSYSEQITQQEESVAKVMGEANDPYIRQLQEQVAQLEVQRDITVAQNPAFVGKEVYNTRLGEIDTQIHALKAKLKKRTDEFLLNLLPGGESALGQTDPSSYLRSIKQKTLQSQIELQSQQARKQALTQAIQLYNAQFERLPRKTMEYARLQREKMSTEKLYLLIDEKYNEANITEQAQMGYIEILDPAVVPSKPSSPKVSQTLLLAFMSGLGFGVLLAFIRERIHMRVRTPEELKKHGYQVLSMIMDMTSETRQLGDGSRERSETGHADSHLIMATNPMAPVAEAYRQLRIRLIHASGANPAKTILATSPEPGEGKTTTICNLAIAFAQSGTKVLLVDADLRRPAIHTAFGIPISPGLTEVLSKEIKADRALQHTDIQNLSILTSGQIPENSADHIGSEGMRRLIEDEKQHFDVILMDSPPALVVTDASVLSALAEQVIIVISAGRTSFESLSRTVEALENVGTMATGIVLNNFNVVNAYGIPYMKSGYDHYGYGYRPSKDGRSPRSEVHTPSS